MNLSPLAAWADAFGGFAWPWMWLALPLPLLVRWLLPAQRSTSAALRVPYAAHHLDSIAGVSGHSAGGRIVWWLWLAWFLLCAAAARPQQLGEPVAPPQQGRQMMLAVDLSGSMSEPDMTLGGQPVERLTAAKAVLADFLQRRVGDRIGLLVFGERAYALTPLTLDRDSVRDQLRDSVVGLAGQRTALGDAIGLSVKRLREQPEGQRVLVLLTDGVNTAGVLEPMKAAELARSAGVRVYTVAFGGGGGGYTLFGIPLPGSGSEDEVDEAMLQQVADMTGGRFFRARDTVQLAGIYAELDRLEPIQSAGQSVRPRVERYPVPLLAAWLVALLALAWRGRSP